jgi:hypothetical protein
MPRDLTDLMESATRSAPAEPHDAADITRLAVRRHRRRTTVIAAAASVAVVAAGSLGYGLTRGQDTSPEPAHDLLHDQTVDLSQAVPASSLSDYTLEPWTIPSVQRFGAGKQPIPTYRSVDASGRLLVVDAPGGDGTVGPFRARLYDEPGGAAQPLQAPASPGTVGSVPITWLPQFYGDGQLLWRPATGQVGPKNGFHVTDLQGGHDEFVPSSFQIGNFTATASTDAMTGRSLWMSVPTHVASKTGLTVSDVYRGTFSGDATRVGSSVSAVDVGPGTAGWVTTHGQVFVQSATGSPPGQVRVPLDPGCRLPSAGVLQSLSVFAVTSSAAAIDERCGSGDKATDRLLAFDLSGRPLVRVTGVLAFNVSFAGDSLVFQGNGLMLRYDLVTGTLAVLGTPTGRGPQAPPQGAGNYVLWYDDRGHVAKFGR